QAPQRPLLAHSREKALKLSFHGADRDVTGSCHLIECAGKHILIDCGLYQGSREAAEENASDFGFDPASIEWVLLTHAHLDHAGACRCSPSAAFAGKSSRPRPPVSSPGLSCSM